MYYLILMPCRLCMKSALAQGSQFIVCNNSSLKFPCIWLWMKATGTYLVKFRYEKLGVSRNEWVDRERLFKRRPNFEAGGLVLNHHICLIKGISFFPLAYKETAMLYYILLAAPAWLLLCVPILASLPPRLCLSLQGGATDEIKLIFLYAFQRAGKL
jgi:hypothetical protein